MPHTYATIAGFNDYLTSGGSTKFASESAAIVALKLAILESVSRRIESVCHRSAFGSGFGPRVGTNRYDGDGANTLFLRDDLLSLSAFTIAPTTGGTGAVPVVDTDYFLANADGYTGTPWRTVILHGQGSPTTFGAGYRTVVATGTWGYANTTVTLTATASAIGTTSTTSVTVSSGAEFSPGQTLLIDSEQLYLTAVSGTTLTVVRGANGTTAATHGAASAIAKYVYDARVVDVAARLGMRRWKARDAGADGTSGGLDIPAQQTLEGEDTIIRRGLSDLLLLGTY